VHYELLFLLLKEFSLPIEHGPDGETKQRQDYIDIIMDYLHSNYFKQISLQELASKLYLSVPYVSKFIKSHLNIGFLDYLNQIRLQHAVEDIENTNHSMTQIACDNGFASPTAFSRVFKGQYGETPSVYRQQAKKKQYALKDAEEHGLKQLRKYFEANPHNEDERGYIRNKHCIADTRNSTPYYKYWQEVYNLGAADDLMRSDVQAHILECKKELRFVYGRVYRLFTKDTFVDVLSEKSFNFSKVDIVIDFLLKNDIIPFIDLGFKRKQLVLAVGKESSVIGLSGNDTPSFSGFDQYTRFLTAFIKHCIYRYGAAAVGSWRFELWQDTELDDGRKREISWYQIFEAAYQSIKLYVPEAKVGGLGFITYDENVALDQFLMELSKQTTIPDFFSVYVYPYCKGLEKKLGSSISTDENFLVNKIQSLRKLFANYHFSEVPLYITEWNMSVSSRNYLHDSTYKGAYILKNLIDCTGKIDVLAYWGNTDLLHEYYDTTSIINGGAGLLCKNGIRKPAFYAFQFMGQLGTYLLTTHENCIVTTGGRNEYYVVCHNMIKPAPEYFYKHGENIPFNQVSRLFPEDPLNLSIQIKNVVPGKYTVIMHSINRNAGSVFDEWLRMYNLNSENDIAVENTMEHGGMDFLKAISVPQEKSAVLSTTGDSLNLTIILQTNEIQLLVISHLPA